MLPATAKNLRIIAVPLTRPKRIPSPTQFNLNRLTYYRFQISSHILSKATSPKDSEGNTGNGKSLFGWPKEGVTNWVTKKAAEIWAGFGNAQGGWKLKVYRAGERLVDRLEFEELALKSIDPSLGPSITNFGRKNPVIAEAEKGVENEPQLLKIPLLYPESIISSSIVLSDLRAYTEHRIPRHRRGFYLWMIIAPFTAPFMLVPVIPNIPFFFCAWRSWSHYRAYRSSQYLQSLLQHNVIIPTASEILDDAYTTYSITPPTLSLSQSDSASPTTNSDSSSSPRSSAPNPSPEHPHELLLTRDAVTKLLEVFGVEPSSSAATDLYRAIEQARMRVESGKDGL